MSKLKTMMTAVGSMIRKQFVAPIDMRGGWNTLIREPSTGAWQRNEEISVDTVLAQHAVYSCITLISNDIAKLRPRLITKDDDGVWAETDNPAYSPVLRKPNRFQNYIQFKQWWLMSKLQRGNAYILKARDARGVVVALYVLDPVRVTPLIATDGSVWYQIGQDLLSNVTEASITVPASEVIHDRMNCLFHPLVGVSPLFASALSASQGLKMQEDAMKFFSNGARPGGILTAPGAISDETAKRLKDHWDTNYAGNNQGKIAVLGDNLKFESLRMTSVEAQIIEQMKWSADVICSTFHVPPFKVQMGTMPTGMKVGDMNQIYYSDCLQILIEEMELCLDEGLNLSSKYETNLDLEGLLRMDPTTQAEIVTKLTGGAVLAPNEGRAKLNYGKLPGGNSLYLQQQNYSMEALAERDANGPPESTLSPGGAPATPAPAAAEPPPPAEDDAEKQVTELFDRLMKGLTNV